jgi:hypothetical protein
VFGPVLEMSISFPSSFTFGRVSDVMTAFPAVLPQMSSACITTPSLGRGSPVSQLIVHYEPNYIFNYTNIINIEHKKHGENILDIHKVAAKHLKNKNLLELSEKAKEKSMLLLEEQGISVIALALSKSLVDFVQHPEKIKA